jgi:putative phage-type endonuclease
MMDRSPYVVVDLEQGSDAWHEWRRQGIGASEAPTILGENPWRTAEQFFEVRCGLLKRKPATKSMALGTALEPQARRAFEIAVGEAFVPICVESVKFPWMHASLDGMSWDDKRVVEIKCGSRIYRESAMFRRVPRQCVGQLQHILAVTGLPEIDFWSYWPKCKPVHLRVARDEAYIRRLIETEQSIWTRIREKCDQPDTA